MPETEDTASGRCAQSGGTGRRTAAAARWPETEDTASGRCAQSGGTGRRTAAAAHWRCLRQRTQHQGAVLSQVELDAVQPPPPVGLRQRTEHQGAVLSQVELDAVQPPSPVGDA